MRIHEDIDFYLTNILRKRLSMYHIPNLYVDKALEHIEEQMVSLLSHWKDKRFRRGLLVTVLDQAMFYEPAGDIEIKCFVILTIRNSYLEHFASDDFKKYGGVALQDWMIKALTQEAVSYFNSINLSDIMPMENEPHYDYYKMVTDKFNVAWMALRQLGNTRETSLIYDKVESPNRVSQDSADTLINKNNIFSPAGIIETKKMKVVQSGMSEEFDDSLLTSLQKIENREMICFYVDSFKMLTRNFKKLLQVIDFVLAHDVPFVTSNYYMENGYIEKRKKILKAAHTVLEADMNLKQWNGVRKKHLAVLKALYNNIS